MSNYLSQQIQYAKPPTDANFELLSKVALMQQQKYDANHQQIQQTLDQFGAIKTLRPEDEEYIAAKLNSITTQANAMGGSIASQSLSDSFMSKIKAASQDPFILNALEQTAKMNSYQKELAAVKEKKPELYNDVNNAYALEQAGYKDYMEGKADKMGTLSYVPFTDYKKEFKDFADNLEKYDNNIKKTLAPDGSGYLYTQEGNYLTKEQIEGKIGTLLSNGAKKQMQIDGWGTYDKGATEEEKLKNVTTAFSSFQTQAIADLDKKINIATLNAGGYSGDDVKETVSALEKHKEALVDSYKTMMDSGNKAGMYTEMYTKQTIGAFSSAFAFNNVGQTIAEDVAYNHAVDRQYKLAAASAKAAKESAQAVQTKTDEDYTPEDKGNVYNDQKIHIETTEKAINERVDKIYNGLDAKTKKGIDDKIEESRAAGKKELTRADVLLDFGLETSNYIDVKDATEITMARQQLTLEKEKFNKYTKQASEEATGTLNQHSDDLAKRLYENPNIKMMWRGTDGKEKLLSSRDILIANHIIDRNGKVLKKIGDVPAVMDSMQKSVLADKFLSNWNGKPIGDTTESFSRAKALGTLFGEGISDIFIADKTTSADNQHYYINPKSKTGKLMIAHAGGEAFTTGGLPGYFKTNESFDGLSEVDDYLKKADDGAVQARVGDLIANDPSTTLGIGRVTTITPGSVAYKDLAAKTEKLTQGSAYSIGIRLIPNQPEMVKITQNVAPTSKNPNPKPTTVEMKISDLPESITKQIDIRNKKQIFTAETMPVIPTHVKYVNNNDKTRVYDITQQLLQGNQQAGEALTLDGAKTALYTGNAKQLGTLDKPTELGLIVNKMLEDKNLHITFDKKKLSSETIVVPQVVRVENGVTTVVISGDPYTGRVTDANAESSFKMARFTPQLYLNTFLNNVLNSKHLPGYIESFKKIYGK